MYDVIIRGGTIVDGTGAPPVTGDVAVQDGRIVEVGEVDGAAHRTIDADGALVTPGWVDVHTHYDGQVTWDDALEPSASNGVTTVVMGNCGVGFAPVRPGDEAGLIDLMEGVEDIPGAALNDGMPWGRWETFGEYLDLIDQRSYAIDIGTHLAHGALRYYVMGERGVANEDATADDLVTMARLTTDALRAGALGVSTSRTIGHRSSSGNPVPGTFAPADELRALADAIGDAGHGVFEAILAGTIGKLPGLGGEQATPLEELPLLVEVSKRGRCASTFTVAQLFEDPDHWRLVLEASAKANADGARLHPQVMARSVTIMSSLGTYHLFEGRPSYEAIAHLPLPERVARMRRPEVREAILSERRPKGANGQFASLFQFALPITFSLEAPVRYEPDLSDSVAARAASAGVDPVAHMYDLLLEDDGRRFFAVLGSNFIGGSLDACREMLLDPNTVTGLGDAGAHVKFISDCSAPTFQITHWARDRQRDQLPIELLVHKQTGTNARLYGLDDRGVIAPGRRADLNVIDFEQLRILEPKLRHDLPTGAARILQGASGYLATLVAGTVIREQDIDTGARPGRLVRGPQAA
jgi:N-acyl-D-amino-acid deacylase